MRVFRLLTSTAVAATALRHSKLSVRKDEPAPAETDAAAAPVPESTTVTETKTAPPSTASVSVDRTDVDADYIKEGGHYDPDGHFVNSHQPDAVHTTGVAGVVNEGLDDVKDFITDGGDVHDHPMIESAPGTGADVPIGTEVMPPTEAELKAQEEHEAHLAKKAEIEAAMHEVQNIPDAPHPVAHQYIPASCEEICNDQCTPSSIFEEVGAGLSHAAEDVDGITPHAFKESAADIGHYVYDIVHSLTGGAALFQHMKSRKLAKQMKAKSPKKSSFLQKKSSACLTECQNLMNQCEGDHADFPDAVPQIEEQWTNKPHASQCVDLMKMHFIARSGNLKWSLKYGQVPTFHQIASLAEPMDVITEQDLSILGTCAEGGDFSFLNTDGAKALAGCMAGETQSYAKTLQMSIEEAERKMKTHKRATYEVEEAEEDAGIAAPEGKADAKAKAEAKPKAAMMLLQKNLDEPVGLNPAVAENVPSAAEEAKQTPAEKSAWELSEDAFYVNDLRCFDKCAAINFNGLLTNCQSESSECFTDFADLLWKTGILSTDLSVGGALSEMRDAHDSDPALQPPSSTSVINPTTWFGSDKPEYPNVEAADYIHLKQVSKHEQVKKLSSKTKQEPEEAAAAPEPAPVEEMSYEEENDPTSPMYKPHHGEKIPPASFCKPSMCAPYPGKWIGESLKPWLRGDPNIDSCFFTGPSPDEIHEEIDNHPNPIYDGAVPEGEEEAEPMMDETEESVAEEVLAVKKRKMIKLSPQGKEARQRAFKKRTDGWKKLLKGMRKIFESKK